MKSWEDSQISGLGRDATKQDPGRRAGLRAGAAALEQAPVSWVGQGWHSGWHWAPRADDAERQSLEPGARADALAVHDVKEKNKQ